MSANPLRLVQDSPRDPSAWEALYRYTSRTKDPTVFPVAYRLVHEIVEAEIDLDAEYGVATQKQRDFSDDVVMHVRRSLIKSFAVQAATNWLLGFDCRDQCKSVCEAMLSPQREISLHMMLPQDLRYSTTRDGQRDIQLTTWKKLREQILQKGGLVLPIHQGQMVAVCGTNSGIIGGASVAGYGLQHTHGSSYWTDKEHIFSTPTRFEAFLSMFAAARIARGDLWGTCWREVFCPKPTPFQAAILDLCGQKPERDGTEWPIELAQRMVWGLSVDTTLFAVSDGVFWGELAALLSLTILEQLRALLAPWQVSVHAPKNGREGWMLRIATDPG